MRKFTEKIQSKFDAIKDALYHRFVRPLREDIVRRGGDTVARGLDLTPREVVRELGIDSRAIAEVMSKADIVECLDMQDIAGYCEVDTRDVAESITDNGFLDYSELSEHLEESEELAQEIAKHLEVPEVRVEYRKIVEGLLKALLSGEGLPKQGDAIHSQDLTVERTGEAS